MSGVKFTRQQLAGTKAGETLFGEQLTKQENKNAKTARQRAITADLTQWVIDWLNDSGEFVAHRQNNIPSRWTKIVEKPDGTKEVKSGYKANQITEKLLDVAGFRYDGLHLELEVKTKDDKLSKEQKARIEKLQKAGAICFVVGDKYTFKQQIKPFMKKYQQAF